MARTYPHTTTCTCGPHAYRCVAQCTCRTALHAHTYGLHTPHGPHNPPPCWRTHNAQHAPNVGGWQAAVGHARTKGYALRRTHTGRRYCRLYAVLAAYGVAQHHAAALASVAAGGALPSAQAQACAAHYAGRTQHALHYRATGHGYGYRVLRALANGAAPSTARYQ